MSVGPLGGSMPTRSLTDALAETLALFEESGAPRTTSEVADRLDLGRRSTYDRLERLVEEGHLETKKAGASARVWWRPGGPTDGSAAEGRGDRATFEALVDAVEEYAIFRLDAEGRVRTWNEGAERIKGYGAGEILGEHFSTFYTEADREAGVPESNLADATEQGSTEDEGWRVRVDGTRFWANVTITAIRDEDGDVEGYLKVTRDMTDRREYEQRLREERDFTRRVLETAPASIAVVDAAGEVQTANGRFDGRFGAATDEHGIDGLTVYDEAGDPVPVDERPYRRVFETGDPVADWQCQVEFPDGQRQWVSFNVAPIAEGEGVERAVVATQDVTQLKEQERHLERQRDEIRAELGEIFARIDDAFFALDEEWRFTHVNERAAAVLDRSAGELLGRNVWEAFPEAVGSTFQEHYERALDRQESVSFEEYYPPLDAWVEVRAYPSESGLSVYFRDVTERKERERELERYETIVETVNDGVYVMDADGRFTMVNDAYAELTGYEKSDLIGEHGSKVASQETTERAAEIQRELRIGERDTPRLEAELQTADGDVVEAEATFSLIDSDGPAERVGVVRDVTERNERERELEESRRRYQTLVENFPNGAVTLVDDDLRYRTIGGTTVEGTGATADELEGRRVREALPPRLADEFAPRYEAALDGVANRFEAEFGGRWYRIHTLPVRDEDGDVFAAMGMSQDVTERRTYERELERRIRQQEAVAELGHLALEGDGIDDLMTEAAERVADVLDADYCEVLDLDAEAGKLLLRQGVGWDEEVVGEATVSAVESDSQAAHTLGSSEPVVVEDLATETRFSGPALLADHDVRSGISVVIGPYEDPWGILGVHDTEQQVFGDTEATFVQSVANVLAAAIARRGGERALHRQRERLAALVNLNRTIREITDAVIDQSTREEIERTVCEHLAATESYEFAWVGDVDVATKTVRPRAEAGTGEYLDDVTITVDPDDERSQGPTGRALRTGEMQTTDNVDISDAHDPWRDHVGEYDFHSSAAVPITHADNTYGVLNVYARRPDAFEGQEREVVARLGEIVGHAIAAAERKQALMSDELVELEFRIQDLFGALDLPAEPRGTITIDHAVPVVGEDFLVYGTTTPDAVDALSALVEALPHWDEVTVDEDASGGTVDFEARLTDPPVLSTVASLGGHVDGVVIEDGDCRLTIHLAPSVEVRRVIDAVEAAYPAAEMLRRQQVDRADDDPRRVRRRFTADLTDRQHAALEAAYHAGFFEWPRDADGTDVADSLDVAPPTFHQHLRKAERKVFESLFATEAT
ncbi:hypothetical protein BRC95_01965 [Halobacteriales archaeon QS_5_68_33]|nr:MAG: hypothetical protein BRC95_01965 [Halobacteriales archaeon QS_5_68_33]